MNLSTENGNQCPMFKENPKRFLFVLLCLFGLVFLSVYYYFFDISIFNSPKLEFSNSYLCKYFINNNETWNFTEFDVTTIGDMTPIQLQLHNSNISYKGYSDLKFSKDCGIPGEHEQLFQLMKFWIKFTSDHNIPWWLAYGSLIGSIRHKDMVAWDSDIDLGMPTQYEHLLRNLSTSRLNISNKQVNIITRPGPHCPYNGPRMDCKGNLVTSQVDGCAFCGPLARVFYNSWKRIDIYLFDVQIHENKLKIVEEGTFEYMSEAPRSPLNWYFPLRNCSFMNLMVLCPKNLEAVLTDYYKTFQSLYKCSKGSWVKI